MRPIAVCKQHDCITAMSEHVLNLFPVTTAWVWLDRICTRITPLHSIGVSADKALKQTGTRRYRDRHQGGPRKHGKQCGECGRCDRCDLRRCAGRSCFAEGSSPACPAQHSVQPVALALAPTAGRGVCRCRTPGDRTVARRRGTQFRYGPRSRGRSGGHHRDGGQCLRRPPFCRELPRRHRVGARRAHLGDGGQDCRHA